MFDYSRLRGRIKEMYGSEQAFAAAIDMPAPTLSWKLNGKSEWRQSEISAATDALNIPAEEIPLYFFYRLSSET